MTDNSVVHTPATGFWKKLWRLSWPYFKSAEWKSAWILLASVVALALIGIYIDVQLNSWNRDFYNVLQTKDLSQRSVVILGRELFVLNNFFYQLAKFTILALLSILVAVYQIYLRQILQIRWRRWMTEQFTRRWLADQMHYRLQLRDYGADNPEQRIESDIASFTGDTLRLSIGVLSNLVNLVTFVGILWGISGPLSFMLGGMSIVIPGYMVWAAILYAGAGTLITFWIGRPLVAANFDQERFGADFRYRMTRIRENSESIALYAGEKREGMGLDATFGKIWNNWWRLIKVTKSLNWFTTFYAQLAIIFPILVSAPRYFAGAIDLGTVFQIVSAFRQVQDSLSWFIDAFQSLASWKATTNRLVTFSDALDRAEVDARQQTLQVERQGGSDVGLTADDIFVPTGRTLMHDVNIQIPRGDRVLISGPSGSGKTTLFRALAGLWPFAKGKLHIPKGARVLFLSQKPYLPLGTLREVVAFPSEPTAFTDSQIKETLAEVHLPHLVDRLQDDDNWSMTLSVGEQQRVAIARALLNKPDWLFMDEATSALDEENERHVYDLVTRRLPDSAIVSIAHRSSVAAYHKRRLAIDPKAGRVLSQNLPPPGLAPAE